MISFFKDKKGESLIEVMISILLLSLVAIVFLKALTGLVATSSKNANKMDASYMAERYMEYLTQYEGKTIDELRTTLTSSVDYTCTETSSSNPYRFKVVDSKYPEMYAIIYVNHKKYRDHGNLSEVKVTVYATDDGRELAFMEDAIYWV